MDVKRAFLKGKIEEEVLHQAPRAWYETLSTYLLDNGFQRGKIDKTLFIKRYKGDILLVQVYVDDIIFGSTKKELCIAFEKLMHEKFQMSFMGELTFFLGLQVKQKKNGIFISQDKYVEEILKKFRFTEVKTASTPMETQKPLLKDEDGEEVDVHMYRSMIGSLMYLTSSRPDIIFIVCACARYQVNPKVSHLHAVKRIFRLISWQCEKQTVATNSTTEAEYVAASSCYGQVKTINGEVQLHALLDGKKIIITEASVRRDLQLADEEGIDCLPNSTIFEQLTLMGPKITAWNEFSSTITSAIICLATNQKFNFSKFIFDSMIRNLDNLFGKFLMYPRFVQVFLDQQLDGLPTHKRIYIAPSHTKKIFGNMRRVGKGFSGRVTPLFQTMVVQNQSQLGKGSTIPTDPHHTPTIIQSSTQPQKTQKPRKPKRKDTQVPQSSDPSENVADEAVHKELGDSLVRAATTASSLEVEQDSGNINKTQSKATPNESSSLGTTSGGGPRCQETIGDTIAQTRFENVSKHSNDSLLARGNTLQSDEDRLKLDELMALCTTLQNRVLDLEKTKTTQHNEIASLKRRVKKLEKKNRSRTHKLKRLYKVGLTARVESSDNEESLGEDASKQGRIDAIDADEEITLVTLVYTAATTVTITTEEITLAQALEALKTSKPKVKGIVFQEPGKSTTTTIISSQQSQDKGKGIMIEEPVKPMKKKDQMQKERLAREKAEKEKEANIALIEEWDDIQQRLMLIINWLERCKHKNKRFNRAVEGKKRAGAELVQESTKKQKVEDDKEIAELKQLMKIIPDEEEVAIDVIPLAVKSLKV
ncbi:putative ribonuclease H-like domain-containing protein [Tanacetum coccineum]